MDISKVTPMGNKVLLELAPRVKKEGLIHLPDNVQLSVWHSGKVVSCGRGKLNEKGHRIPPSVTTGQEAVFRTFSNDWQLLKDDDGTEFVLVDAEHLEFCIAPGPEGDNE